jgi:hypothetical protein
VHEEAIYRCVNPACARLMPRPVKFCPWCGTAQAGLQPSAPAPALDAGTRRAVEAEGEPAHEPANVSAAAELSGWSDAPLPPVPSTPEPSTPEPDEGRGKRAGRDAGGGTAASRAGLAGTDARAGAPQPAAAPARGGWLGTAFGHGAGNRPPPAAESVPRPEIPARPAKPQREPIRLRYWVLVLLILWGVWLLARPNSARKIEQRIDHAVALANECKAKEAQDELIALRKTRATSAQLERLQASLNEGAAACTRKRQKEKAWNEASAAAESALEAGNPERASARLQVYTRRYGDDARARALRQRIEDARHPLAAPSA